MLVISVTRIAMFPCNSRLYRSRRSRASWSMGGNAGMTAPLRACRDEGTLPGYFGGIVAALAAVGGLASRCLAEANPLAVGGQGGSRALRPFGLGHGDGLEIHEETMDLHSGIVHRRDAYPCTC